MTVRPSHFLFLVPTSGMLLHHLAQIRGREEFTGELLHITGLVQQALHVELPPPIECSIAGTNVISRILTNGMGP